MNKGMRIVFMGTPDFAVRSLEILVENGCHVVGVITAPDKPAGRGREMRKSAVKVFAEKHGLKILQPSNLKDEVFLNELKALQPDLQVVVAFRMLPEAVWQLPAKGTFNLHASLLPQYRGAAPINWAIINGERETVVSTFLIDKEIDTGKIIFQEKVPISNNDNAGILHDRLMEVGARLVLKTVKTVENGNVPSVPQSELKGNEVLKPAPKIFRENCQIDWSRGVDELYNFIRGLSPYPAAYTFLVSPEGEETQLKIFNVTKELGQARKPGGIETDGKTELRIAAADGSLLVNELQLAGKKRMKTGDFLRGFTVSEHWKCQ